MNPATTNQDKPVKHHLEAQTRCLTVSIVQKEILFNAPVEEVVSVVDDAFQGAEDHTICDFIHIDFIVVVLDSKDTVHGETHFFGELHHLHFKNTQHLTFEDFCQSHSQSFVYITSLPGCDLCRVNHKMTNKNIPSVSGTHSCRCPLNPFQSLERLHQLW